MQTGDFLWKTHKLVSEKISELQFKWERYNQYQKSQKAYHTWRYLSLQSHIGSDLLIDFCTIAEIADKREYCKGELWVRDNGTHFIRTEEDAQDVLDAFGKPIFKVNVEWDSIYGFKEPEVITEGCIDLNLTEEQKILAAQVDMEDFKESCEEQECLREFRMARKGKKEEGGVA